MTTVINVFSLEDAVSWKCKIWHYAVSHSILTLHLEREDARLWVSFLDVRYFQGAVGWTGAEFVKASSADYIKFWQEQNRLNNQVSDDNLLQRLAGLYSLYTVPTQNIKIVAASGHLSNDPPELSCSQVFGG